VRINFDLEEKTLSNCDAGGFAVKKILNDKVNLLKSTVKPQKEKKNDFEDQSQYTQF